jgi:putative hydrolase of HD superfamily
MVSRVRAPAGARTRACFRLDVRPGRLAATGDSSIVRPPALARGAPGADLERMGDADDATDAASGLARFFHAAGRLKETARAGWRLRGIDDPESVAEHSYRAALLALVLAPRAEPPLDVARCVAMALVHDLAESVVGDITPYDGVAADEKRRREEEAMSTLASLAGDDSLLALWREYDGAGSPEARFVKELDKLETVLQAFEYGTREDVGHAALDEFWQSAGERLASPVARALLDALRRERDADG